MKQLFQKTVPLAGAVLALCALGAPSMASAASWSSVGTTHQLFSSNFVFTQETPHVEFTCAASELDVDVASATTLEVTGAGFRACGGLGGIKTCMVTITGTKFPWTVTAPTTTNIQIHGLHLDVQFENNNGASTPCPINGTTLTLTGTVTGGSWDPSANGPSRRVTLKDQPGLTSHSAAGSSPVQTSGDLRDTTGTLDLFD